VLGHDAQLGALAAATMTAEQEILAAGNVPQPVLLGIDAELPVKPFTAVVTPRPAELDQAFVTRLQRFVEAQVVPVILDGTVGVVGHGVSGAVPG